jgi:hypothetical protein
MLTSGKIAFAICFAVVFIAAMIWSYNKDSFQDKLHFKGASKTLAIIIIVLVVMFLFVKMRHYI